MTLGAARDLRRKKVGSRRSRPRESRSLGAPRERVTYRDVEAEIIAHAIDQSDQAAECLLLSELVLVEDLGDGANRPRIWPFHDGIEKEIAMMIAGERGLGIQEDGAPIPALRDDAGEACADAGIAGAVRKQDAKFSRNVWARLIL